MTLLVATQPGERAMAGEPKLMLWDELNAWAVAHGMPAGMGQLTIRGARLYHHLVEARKMDLQILVVDPDGKLVEEIAPESFKPDQ